MNTVLIVGTVNKSTVRRTSTGQEMLCLNVTTQEAYIDKTGQRKEMTCYHDFIVFGSLCEANKAIATEGAIVSVQGRLNKKKNKEDKYELQCEVKSLSVLVQGMPQNGAPQYQQPLPQQYAPPPQQQYHQPQNGAQQYQQQPPQQYRQATPMDDDNLPF